MDEEARGAGNGNRTRVTCLECRCSAIELYRQIARRLASGVPPFTGWRLFVFVEFPVWDGGKCRVRTGGLLVPGQARCQLR